MRILAVAELYPWPALDGYRQRLVHILSGLARAGELELFALAPEGARPPESDHLDVLSRIVTAPTVMRSSRETMAMWARSEQPRRMLGFDWTEPRRELAAWGPEPDVVWYSLLDTWAAVEICSRASPRSWTSTTSRTWPCGCVVGNVHGSLRGFRHRTRCVGVPAGWRHAHWTWWMSVAGTRLQRRCSEEVDRVVVCSELDVERSECANAVAIPNGADTPQHVQVDRSALRGAVPTMLFVGALDYEPNTDAVEWFVGEVLPVIRRRMPKAVVRVVGRGAPRGRVDLGVAGVDLIGEVDEIRPELDAADVAIVPIRVGAGTRLKVIEALRTIGFLWSPPPLAVRGSTSPTDRAVADSR